MHCSQVSSGASQAYAMRAAQGRKAAGCGEAKPAKSSDGCGEGSGCDDAPRAARAEGQPARNPLVSAMMDALKGLVPASAGTTTSEAADTAEAGTDASAAKDQAKALKEAAYGFAHELFQALKAVGAPGAEASSESAGCRPHRCGGYGEHKAGASGYGGLAQGLQRLAQSVAPAPVTSATTTAASTTPAASPSADTTTPASPATATPMPEAPADPAPAKPAELATVKTPAPAGTAAGITINLTLNFGAAAANGGADAGSAASNESPLLAAFKKLMLALNPKAGDTASGDKAPTEAADAKKPAELLQAFLQQIAKGLGGEASMTADALPAKGSLINLSA